MTETDAKKIIASMMVSFGSYRPVDVDYVAREWSKYLSDYTYEQISSALKEYILTEKTGFAPSIGQLANLVKVQKKRKYFEELEQMLLADTCRNLETGKDDSKTLEMKRDGIPMQEKYKERLEDMGNGDKQ